MSEKQSKTVEEEIEDLKQRVKALEEQLGGGSNGRGSDAMATLGDQYDNQVLNALRESDSSTVTLSELTNLYRRAGVRNKNKIRDRLRYLESEGVLENVGIQRWRFVDHE